MIISYLFIVLYDKNYRVITIIWSPFRVLLSLFKNDWDIRTSIIDSFATFIFLSNVKILSVSFDMLIATRVYQLYGDHYNYTLNLLYAGNLAYFGKEHLPFAILAILVLCVSVLLPIIFLALYPLRLFQKLLNVFPVRWYILHTFMDSFQGCYKDGTQPGTRDCRWCVSLFFVVRLLQFILYSQTDHIIFLVLSVMVLILYATLIATIQPFKQSVAHYNVINIVLLQFLTLFSITAIMINFSTFMAPQFLPFLYMLGVFFGLIPLLYVVGMLAYWIYVQRRNIFQRLRAWRNG